MLTDAEVCERFARERMGWPDWNDPDVDDERTDWLWADKYRDAFGNPHPSCPAWWLDHRFLWPALLELLEGGCAPSDVFRDEETQRFAYNPAAAAAAVLAAIRVEMGEES